MCSERLLKQKFSTANGKTAALMGRRFLFCREFLMFWNGRTIMNSDSPGHSKDKPRWYLVEAHPVIRAMVLSDRTQPLLCRPPVWESPEMLRLMRLLEKHLPPPAWWKGK
jgi:hypothetical protein